MEAQVQRLVDKAWDGFQKAPEGQRFLIAIAGIPGSGKTTLSQKVTEGLNARHATLHPENPQITSVPVAAFIPMDGYHLTRAQLSAMPNPIEAHARRGAEFTFDGPAFLKLVQSLRVPLSSTSSTEPQTIYVPSFDHAIKDPKENDISILPGHRIIIFEGNYLALDREPWSRAARMMDELWFVEVEFDTARRRLVRRHVAAGIARDAEDAGKRADENDLVNGRQIVDERMDIDEVIVSREDDSWEK